MPVQNKPNMNYGTWAENGNIEIPSSEKVEQGWTIEKPLNEQMNWLQNRSDRMLQYLNQRGIPEWDSSTEYPLYAYATRGGVVYKALSPNQDSDPTLYPAIWSIAFLSYTDFITYRDDINNIKNIDGFLEHYLRKTAPIMTAPALGVAYNDSSNTSGYGFSGTRPQITNDGQIVAEFSGGTNPQDVVTHEQLALAIQNYKVGDIYITADSGDPATRLGYGDWERFAEGRTLVSFSTSVSNSIPEWVKVIGTTYGEYEHKLTKDEMPNHTHDMNFTTGNITGNDRPATQNTSATSSNLEVGMTGGDQPHNNVQPSIVVFMWKRIA